VKSFPIRAQAALPISAPGERDNRWRLTHLGSAPHRLGFAAGAAMLATTALWWASMLAARQGGLAVSWAVAPSAAHGLVMALGFMPFFIIGFAFTAGPRWLGLPDVAATRLRTPVLLMLAGWAFALAGFHWAAPLAAAGVAAVALGWSTVVHRFIALLRASQVADKLHPTLLACSAGFGALSLWAAAAALAFGNDTALRAATQCALWGFLAPLFVTVSHRMLPFFTASALPELDAWRPNALLWAMLAALVAELPFALAELWWWPLPAAARAAQVAFELPAALLLLWLALRWGLVQSLKIRLLAMLHAGFLWLGLTLALGAVSHALMAGRGPDHSLGLAPLHALTMGFLASTLLAMATRVTAGHSGRPLAADDLAWALFWVLQTAVLLRLAGALWPAAAMPLLLVAAAAWAVAMVGWSLRYGRWLGRPRADGRPG
jgi:uncharacterized protein involved in response to NO